MKHEKRHGWIVQLYFYIVIYTVAANILQNIVIYCSFKSLSLTPHRRLTGIDVSIASVAKFSDILYHKKVILLLIICREADCAISPAKAVSHDFGDHHRKHVASP